MLRQQLLLPVILYDWFSHTIWLFNNCVEDIKRTPVPSYQHHCQWASAPTAKIKKRRKKERKKEFIASLMSCGGSQLEGNLCLCWLTDCSSRRSKLNNASTIKWTHDRAQCAHTSNRVHIWGQSMFWYQSVLRTINVIVRYVFREIGVLRTVYCSFPHWLDWLVLSVK